MEIRIGGQDYGSTVREFDFADMTAELDETSARVTVSGGEGSADGGAGFLVVAANDSDSDIKDRADYVCDGTADQSEINTALGNGPVLLAAGTYSVTAPVTVERDFGILRGVSLEAQLVPTSGFSGSAVVEVQDASDEIVEAATVSDLYIDGSNYTSTEIDGVLFRTFQGVLRNVHVANMSGNGVQILGNDEADTQWSSYDCQLSDLLIKDCALAGLLTGNDGTDFHCRGLTAAYCEDGIRRAGGSAAQFTDFHLYGNTRNNIRLENGSGTRDHYTNGKIQHSGEHGVYFIDGVTLGSGGTEANAVEVQFVNCDFNCNGKSNTNPGTYSIVEFTFNRTANRPQFIGCTFGNSDGVADSNLALYGINLSSTGQEAVIVGCSFNDSLNGAGVKSTGDLVRSRSTATDTIVLAGNYGIADSIGASAQPESLNTA